MKLREHPSMMGRWPPSPCEARANSRTAPADCLDVLKTAHYLGTDGTGLPGIGLATVFKEQNHIREVFIYDQEFAKSLSKFLREHKGSTVRELGDMDVTFELLPKSDKKSAGPQAGGSTR